MEINKMITILSRKGCKITGSTIDVAKATELGNKTWGYLEHLRNEHDYSLAGVGDYKRSCKTKYGKNEEEERKEKKSFTIPDHVLSQKALQGKLYHAYSLLPQRSENAEVSEYHRLQDASQFLNPYDRRFARKSQQDKKDMKVAKSICSFGNQTVFQSDFEEPLRQRSKSRKPKRVAEYA